MTATYAWYALGAWSALTGIAIGLWATHRLTRNWNTK